MKASDWNQLGRALLDNAELLEELASADDYGMPEPDHKNKTMSWMISKGLVESDQGMLYLNSLLDQLGAEISAQGFERAAPDLEETLISIKNHCNGYLAAKRDMATSDMDKHLKQLGRTCRQIVSHLRHEFLSTRNSIESDMGYALRPSERLRDIHNAIERLKRLHQKLLMFSYRDLSRLAQGDRVISRLLVGTHNASLNAAIERRREDLHGLIDRLDTLSQSVRKRNQFRQLMQAVETHIISGQQLNVLAMLDDPKMASFVPASALDVGGYIETPAHAGHLADDFEQLIADLPEQTRRTVVADLQTQTKPKARTVQPKTHALEEVEVPFAKPHFDRMIQQLVATGAEQSAVQYWKEHGDESMQAKHWLYALDYYFNLQIAVYARKGKRLDLELRPVYLSSTRRGIANKKAWDLILGRANRLAARAS